MSDSALSRAKEICTQFGLSHYTDQLGNLIFDYGTAQIEHYSASFHLVPVRAGIWQSKSADLNLVREVFLCTSAMDGVAFLYFHGHRYPRHEELLFISMGCCFSFPAELMSLVNKAALNLVGSHDITDRIIFLKFCLAIRNLVFCVKFDEGLISAGSGTDVFRMTIEKFTLRAFFKLIHIRPFFRQYLPGGEISFLAQLRAGH